MNKKQIRSLLINEVHKELKRLPHNKKPKNKQELMGLSVHFTFKCILKWFELELKTLSQTSDKKGCGKRVRVGYNKKLDCPITSICGISGEDNYLCLGCSKKSEVKKNE